MRFRWRTSYQDSPYVRGFREPAFHARRRQYYDPPNLEPGSANINGSIYPVMLRRALSLISVEWKCCRAARHALWGLCAGGVINLSANRPDQVTRGISSWIRKLWTRPRPPGADVQVSNDLSLRGAVDYERHDGYESVNLDSDNRLAGACPRHTHPTTTFRFCCGPDFTMVAYLSNGE